MKKKQRTLIVGSTGDIGSGFRALWGNKALYASRIESNDVQAIDLEKLHLWPFESLREVSHCLIAAGYSKPDDCFDRSEKTYAVNVYGTGKLLDRCKSAGVVPIFLSSEQVYGNLSGTVGEEVEASPVTVYGQQKLEIETKIRSEFSQYLILRISRVEYSFHTRSSMIGDCATKILHGERSFAYDQLINLLFIDDLVKITERLIECNISGTFNIGGLETLPRSTIAEKVLKRLYELKPNIACGHQIKLLPMSSFKLREPRPTDLTMNYHKLYTILNDFTPLSFDAILGKYKF